MNQHEPLIIHVAAYYPPRLGGLERVAQNLAEMLAERRDVEVVTTTCGMGASPAATGPSRLRVNRFPAVEVAHTPLSVRLVLRLLAAPRRAIVHVHVAQAFLPEVVWLTSAIRRRPYVVHFHLDVDASGRLGRLLPLYKRFVMGPVLRRAAAVLALSPQQAESIVARHGVRSDRITIMPNGVDEAFYSAGRGRPAAEAPLRLLFVGRLDAQKNVRRLLDAMPHVAAPVELVIVGDGEQRQALEDRCGEIGLRGVRFVGAQGGADLLGRFAWADAFVLPSDKEGMPLVLLEAMAAGLAVVATDVPGSRELVDGVGLLAEPRPEALGAAIQRVATDRVLLAELAEKSRVRGLTHSWSGQVDQLEDLYATVGARS